MIPVATLKKTSPMVPKVLMEVTSVTHQVTHVTNISAGELSQTEKS
jgi:hypothetical protein